MEQVPVSYVNLSKEKEQLLNIGLNKISGDWDDEKLSLLLFELAQGEEDVLVSGFEESEIDDIIKGFEKKESKKDPDEVPVKSHVRKKRLKVQKGDLWALGNHKLYCGDSTKETDTKDLLGTEKMDLLLEDPPWNVNYGGTNHPSWKKRSIENDNLGEKFEQFIQDHFTITNKILKEGAPIYVFMSAQEWPLIDKTIRKSGAHWSSTIIWAKDHAVLSRKDYHTQYEPIWYGWKEGAPRLVELTDRKQSDLWNHARPTKSEEHPTMKPVELLERAIKNSSNPQSKVYDGFGGSRSTLIACERTKRICFMMEISPEYCETIITR